MILDRYNGRYCVTPEYPEGVYAYFCTIDGVSGAPKFPYFIGPDFYSEADEINWNGNGLQKTLLKMLLVLEHHISELIRLLQREKR